MGPSRVRAVFLDLDNTLIRHGRGGQDGNVGAEPNPEIHLSPISRSLACSQHILITHMIYNHSAEISSGAHATNYPQPKSPGLEHQEQDQEDLSHQSDQSDWAEGQEREENSQTLLRRRSQTSVASASPHPTQAGSLRQRNIVVEVEGSEAQRGNPKETGKEHILGSPDWIVDGSVSKAVSSQVGYAITEGYHDSQSYLPWEVVVAAALPAVTTSQQHNLLHSPELLLSQKHMTLAEDVKAMLTELRKEVHLLLTNKWRQTKPEGGD
ncbi:hypothetical protein MUG91_G254n4 [Manis pentadactyla]|nr:hypothetical protein MUG91_G254n4 [Manis pentadactyla]